MSSGNSPVIVMGPPRCGNIFLASAIRLRYPDETWVIEPGSRLPDGSENRHSIQNLQSCERAGARLLSPVRCPRKAAESFLRFQGITQRTQQEVFGYLNHYRALLSSQRDADWHFVDFNSLTESPQAVLNDLGTKVPLTGRRFVVRWEELRSATKPTIPTTQVPGDLWNDVEVLFALREAHKALRDALHYDCGCLTET